MTDSTIPVPDKLRGAHPSIAATRSAATRLKADDDGRLRIGPRPGTVHLILSRSLLRRALLIAHAIFQEAERRGWNIESYEGGGYKDHAGTAVVIGDHAYSLELHELTETLPFTEEDISEWRKSRSWLGREETGDPPPQMKRKRATGRLSIQMPHGYRGGRAKWTEGPRGPLEAKLGSVFEALEQRAIDDDEHDRQRAIQQEQFRREQEAREERALRQRIDRARSERAITEAAAWERSAQIRSYVVALRERAHELDSPERERVLKWCDWAADWANRSDPTRYTELIVGFDERDEFGAPSAPGAYAR